MGVRPFSAAEGNTVMSYRLLRRCITVGVLAAVLLGATPAQARDLGTTGRAWQWLQDAWSRGVSAFWERAPVPSGRGGGMADQRKEGNGLDPNGSDQRKQGLGLDPNGSPSPAPGPAAPACSLCSDQGHGL